MNETYPSVNGADGKPNTPGNGGGFDVVSNSASNDLSDGVTQKSGPNPADGSIG